MYGQRIIVLVSDIYDWSITHRLISMWSLTGLTQYSSVSRWTLANELVDAVFARAVVMTRRANALVGICINTLHGLTCHSPEHPSGIINN